MQPFSSIFSVETDVGWSWWRKHGISAIKETLYTYRTHEWKQEAVYYSNRELGGGFTSRESSVSCGKEAFTLKAQSCGDLPVFKWKTILLNTHLVNNLSPKNVLINAIKSTPAAININGPFDLLSRAYRWIQYFSVIEFKTNCPLLQEFLLNCEKKIKIQGCQAAVLFSFLNTLPAADYLNQVYLSKNKLQVECWLDIGEDNVKNQTEMLTF